tara:strand:- start:896 stop:1741 length:846 start_codon:yes stop_codon:yes gene_type:complete
MNKIYVLLFLCLLFLNNCSKKEKEISIISNDEIEMQMISSYNEGLKALEDGDVILAARKFSESEMLYPQSDWAPKSSLMSAYAYYSQDYYEESITELNRFLKIYPNYPDLSYAHYLLGVNYYESIANEKKDLKPLVMAKDKFNFIINTYPQSDFAFDSKFKLNLINDILASKEMYIGRYYMDKEKWISAMNRFKFVIKEHDTTVYVEEALHRLVEIHYKIGLEEEAKKYAKLLGYNYQSGDWYKTSYKIFNKNYQDFIPKVKKEKKSVIKKKFKSLFLKNE